MDRLQSMEVFSWVVELGSFSRAADRLNLSKATVTSHVAALENRLGVRLLNRTTRRLNLTEDGAAYLEHCKRVLADIAETESSLARGKAVPRGRLRVDMPVSIGLQYVLPALPRFSAQYPELEVVATLTDQRIDLIAEGVDAALRTGALEDSSFVARKVYDGRFIVAASPSYLERFGEPKAPDELSRHNCLAFYRAGIGRDEDWVFEREGERIVRPPNGRLALSSGEALVDAAIAGIGIVYFNDLLLVRSMAARQLRPILTEWTRRDPLPISVIYPQNRHLSAKVRAFVEFVTGLFARTQARA
jgi:LysR family transcriptional regulator for bpeEF and oprC